VEVEAERALGRLLTERAAILAAAPRAFDPAEGPLAAQRAGLAASAGWGLRDGFERVGIPLVPYFLFLLNAVALMMIPHLLITWILGRGKWAAGWILLAVPLWRAGLPPALFGACLGALWVLALKRGSLIWLAPAAPLFFLFLGLSPLSMASKTSSEPGPWRLRIGKGRLFLGRSGCDAFLAAAFLAIVAGFHFFPPRAVHDP
jgi:hypothetical protein